MSHNDWIYVFLNKCSISWSSRKQPTVALSTTEAEYMAAKEATKEAIWLRNLFNEHGFKQTQPTKIHEDNQSCIALAKESGEIFKSKAHRH